MAALHNWRASDESRPRKVQMDAAAQGERDWQARTYVLPVQHHQAKSWDLESSE